MPEIAVVDASALIALEKINLLDILCRLYDEVDWVVRISHEGQIK